MRRYAFWLTSLSALAISFGAAAPARAEGRDWTGQKPPEIYAASGLHGISAGATLEQYNGRVVVLKFFFTSCPTCRGSLPAFESLFRRYSPRGVQFIAIAFDSREAVSALMSSEGYDFPVAIDPSGLTPSRYGVYSYPTNYIIGADGLVKSYDNLSEWTLDRELTSAAPARNTNLEELGVVPAALNGVKDAAQRNDYGEVLRIVEAHRDLKTDASDVVAAANRIREVARAHWTRRVDKIRALWNQGDTSRAYADSQRFAEDFRGTTFYEFTLKWSRDLGAMLSAPAPASGGAAAR